MSLFITIPLIVIGWFLAGIITAILVVRTDGLSYQTWKHSGDHIKNDKVIMLVFSILVWPLCLFFLAIMLLCLSIKPTCHRITQIIIIASNKVFRINEETEE